MHWLTAWLRWHVTLINEGNIKENPKNSGVTKGYSEKPAETPQPKSVKGKIEITQEPTLEDISNFLNENFKANETNNGTKTKSVQESSVLGKGEKPKKPSQRGKTPLDKRKIKDKEVISALKAEVFDAYSIVQQYFISGGRVLPSEIKRLFNSDSEAKSRVGYSRTKEKKVLQLTKFPTTFGSSTEKI